jgi:hypothetical protein
LTVVMACVLALFSMPGTMEVVYHRIQIAC